MEGQELLDWAEDHNEMPHAYENQNCKEDKMTQQTIKDAALAYEPKQTRNISELDRVTTNFVLQDGKGTDKDGKGFDYKYISINGEEFRLPGKVLGDLKAILAKKPTLAAFSVTRKGTGINTQYTVIPLD